MLQPINHIQIHKIVTLSFILFISVMNTTESRSNHGNTCINFYLIQRWANICEIILVIKVQSRVYGDLLNKKVGWGEGESHPFSLIRSYLFPDSEMLVWYKFWTFSMVFIHHLINTGHCTNSNHPQGDGPPSFYFWNTSHLLPIMST